MTKLLLVCPDCTGNALARVQRVGHHLLHPLFWDPELSRRHLHPQIQIPNAFPVLDNHFKFRILEHEGKLEFLAGGIELLWGKCTVFPGPVQGILAGGILIKVPKSGKMVNLPQSNSNPLRKTQVLLWSQKEDQDACVGFSKYLPWLRFSYFLSYLLRIQYKLEKVSNL